MARTLAFGESAAPENSRLVSGVEGWAARPTILSSTLCVLLRLQRGVDASTGPCCGVFDSYATGQKELALDVSGHSDD